MQYECFPKQFKEALQRSKSENADKVVATLPKVSSSYQNWYSESQALIKQILPDRLSDFIKLYEKPKARKIDHESYVIEDYLIGLRITSPHRETVVGPSAAIPRLEQQLNILKSAVRVFVSTLFNIKQVLQSELFDSELEAASVLNKNGFVRGAGAMAGVVLEHHLSQVCQNHNINIKKKNPTIADFNDALKDANILMVHNWRFIQHLGDLRNLCDHKKTIEPTKDQGAELIQGVQKAIKTIF